MNHIIFGKTSNVFLTTVIMLLVLISSGQAQYEVEWTVNQEYYESGMLYFDFNHDGSLELTKFLYNTVSVFDGAMDYQVIWWVTAPNHDELLIWDVFDMDDEDEMAVFTASNLVENVSTRLLGYDVFEVEPLWETEDYPGYFSFISLDNLDEDPDREIVWGLNNYDADAAAYTSQFFVISANNGNVEFESPVFEAYMVGPYIGDLDHDGYIEIMINLYFAGDETSTLTVYSLPRQGNAVANQPLPRDFQASQNFPNPFNMNTVIPLNLRQSAQTQISVFNVQGQRIAEIYQGNLNAGQHQFRWNGFTAQGLRAPGGTYFYEIQVGESRFRKPMVLVK